MRSIWPAIKSVRACETALYGTVHDTRACHLFEQLTAQVLSRSIAGGCEGQLVRIAARVRNELLYRLHREWQSHRKHILVRRELTDQLQLAIGVVREIGYETLIDRKVHHVSVAERVAIRPRAREQLHTDDPARARPIVDDERLIHLDREFGGEQARGNVSRPPTATGTI